MAPAVGLASLLLQEHLQHPPEALLAAAQWAPSAADGRICPEGGALGVSAAAAAAAARLAAAASVLLVPARADAAAAPSLPAPPPAHPWGGGSCPLGYGKHQQQHLLSLKEYPHVAVPSTLSLLSPYRLLWLFLKNTGLVFLLQTNIWLYQALDAEEQALQQGTQAQLPPYPDVVQQLVRSGWNSLRELLTALTRSEIKHAINAHASSRTAWKVLKDPRESLTRKALFYADTPSWALVPLYTTTMLRTQLPMYAAELLVAWGYDALEEARRLMALAARAGQAAAQGGQGPYGGGGGGGGERLVGAECLAAPGGEAGEAGAGASAQLAAARRQLQQLLAGRGALPPGELRLCARRWALRAGRHVLRVTGTSLCAALGAGVAAALAPRERAGVWAVRGHIVADLVFANLLLVLLDSGAALAFGGAPGEDGGSKQRQHHQQQHHHEAHASSPFGLPS